MAKTFFLDGKEIPFQDGQTILDAAMKAGVWVPHLCAHPLLDPHSSCRLCTVLVSGRPFASCTQPAVAGQQVSSDVPEVRQLRRTILQMMFVDGNHYCPSCERSGSCQLQATAYSLGLQDNHFANLFPKRGVDSSHPDVHLDRDRCILCERCVRASRALDHKNVFGMVERGIKRELTVSSPSGTLVDSAIAATDQAVELCPTGALQPKRTGFQVPIGERLYDQEPIDVVGLRQYQEFVHGK
jgi:[NiFe] hydrogenase diaphorase moiety small subunit